MDLIYTSKRVPMPEIVDEFNFGAELSVAFE